MNINVALKLYSFGLHLVHDPSWTGTNLFDRLKQHIRGEIAPKDMLYKTLKEGLLFQLGQLVYYEYIQNPHRFNAGFLTLTDDHVLWYLQDYLNLLADQDVPSDDPAMLKATRLLNDTYELYEIDETMFWKRVRDVRGKAINCAVRLGTTFKGPIAAAKQEYASDFAHRVFQDRLLCQFISTLLVETGIPNTAPRETPEQWVSESTIPVWAIKSVIGREREKCAGCGTDVEIDLAPETYIAHIVPLSVGGTNDLCNLQLLCNACRTSRLNNNIFPGQKLIPDYLRLNK